MTGLEGAEEEEREKRKERRIAALQHKERQLEKNTTKVKCRGPRISQKVGAKARSRVRDSLTLTI